MNEESSEAPEKTWQSVITSVMLFWFGYLAITIVVAYATRALLGSGLGQLIAWGFISSAALIVLARFLVRSENGSAADADGTLKVSPSSIGRFSWGFLIGAASFAVHLAIITHFAGPIRFEWVPGVGALAALIYFVRFLSTSCMEEVGFRGYSLRLLTGKIGVWPAVCITSLAFGLSHLGYGYDLWSIAFGVIPCGLLWGMSAIATRGLAVPIGLHAAWNFASWSAGGRSETGFVTLIIEDDAVSAIQQVGLASQLSIFGTLTLAFWFVHRRKASCFPEKSTREGSPSRSEE